MADNEGLCLTVELCGEIQVLQPGEVLTFGRMADLVVDDNPFLHRQLGRLFNIGSIWWLQNVGSQIPVSVVDRDSISYTTVASGNRTPVIYSSALLRFSAGQCNYEISLDQRRIEPERPEPGALIGGMTTVHVSSVTLNQEQRLLLVALALPHLREPHRPDRPLPTNQEAAARLGWTMPKFNRKLDYLCDRMDRAGFRGLRGSAGDLAVHRRSRLVRYAIESNLVTLADAPSTW